ncbi:early nodulin-like protein 13 [Magnolia sinica]|uniref:early nodulin-like protein 13 n=1 Tax=Magnolia sinica TaxID=86752 RepID=UPI00265985B9|nr:early nodulin-like protein 13 [Magnolia sinica]
MASSRTLYCYSLIIISVLFTLSEATDFLVGGKINAWEIPSSPSDSLNGWAEENRFQIGDSLVWKFDGAKDSVMQVSRDDYLSCNTSNPIAAHKGGDVTVKLEKSGPFYFINGTKGHCGNGQKLIVAVLSKGRRHSYGISPAPSIEFEGPTISPTSGASGLVVLRSGFLGALIVFLVGMVL